MRRIVMSATVLGVFASASLAGAPDAGVKLAQTPDSSRVGQQVAAFKLQDYLGADYAWDQYADKKAVVVAFLGVDCPLVKLYVTRLNELAKEFEGKDVAFVAINANRQDSVTHMGHFVRNYKLGFPYLKDVGNKVADDFGAQRVPELFVLDAKRVIRYHGRIDDQYGYQTGVGYQKPAESRRDLAIAIAEVIEDKDVSVATTPVVGCLIGRVRQANEQGKVTYSNQIARIFQNRCVECHREGEIAPFTLTDYEQVAGWADMIAEVVRDERMPPWSASHETSHIFANNSRLTDDERELIFAWVEDGAPEGDPKQLPEPRKFTQGWQIPQPDQIMYMSEKPFQVQADGIVEYQYYTVDPGWTEDKWIRAAEARPGNRAVVHHIIVFIEPPGGGGGRGEFRTGGILSGYAPGMPPKILRDDMAILVPANSKLVFQMHYTPVGTVQEDRSYCGVVFADPKTVEKRAKGGMIFNVGFEIPPHDGNYRVDSKFRFMKDTLLLDLTPHMHLRGKSFQYVATYPDGRKEILLDIPRYDFNWQLTYELVEPKLMPRGTEIEVVAHFNNSEENLANPDPSASVRFGEQTQDEMMIGFFSSAPVEDDLATRNAKKRLLQQQSEPKEKSAGPQARLD